MITGIRNRYLAMIFAVVLAACSQLPADEAEFITVLQTGSPAEKAIACKQLAIHGTDKAVPELAKLLADEQLASWARIALEAIPGPVADEALRKALPTLEGKLLIGTINSVGVRRDALAGETLAGQLKNQDNAVAAAAALALGRIGNAAAAEALQASLANESATLRSAAAEGCILCAEARIAEGKHADAVALYDAVRQADVAKPRKLEATRGAILARQAAGVPLLVEQLQSPDKQFVQVALSAARELPGKEVDDALANELTKAPAARGALLIYALADREITAIPAGVVDAAAKGEKPVRIAAIDLIGRRGNVANLDALLAIAADGDADVAQAAKSSLNTLPGEDVNLAIIERLGKANAKSLPVLIALIGERRVDAVAPLKKSLDSPDKSIRCAALAALGETVGPADLAVLISQVVAPKHTDQSQEAFQALKAASIRMPDRDACANELAAALQRAPVATKTKLLEILGAVQGKQSLATIATAVKGNNDALIDTGTRVLGDWMTVDAAPVLFDVASNSKVDKKYQIRALRGYIRYMRQFPMPARDRAEMCQKALAAADRADEQKLVLEVLERYPSGDTLRLASKAAAIPAMKQEANRVAALIAQKFGGPSASVQEMLAKAGREPMKIEVLKAVYGSGGQQKDVTEALQQLVGMSPLVGLPKNTYNDVFGGDPAPNAKKSLHIEYRIADRAGAASFDENAPIVLPAPK